MNQTERKSQLIAQGALHRTEIMLARDAVRNDLRPDVLARSAMQQLVTSAYTAFRKQRALGLPVERLQSALPLVITAVSALATRKSLLKSVLGAIVVAGATAVVVAALSRTKTGSREATAE